MDELVLLLMLMSLSTAHLPTLPIQVSGGLLRGTIALDGSHLRYNGIPYAVASRFQAPEPAPKWDGIFNAFNENIRCPQRSLVKSLVTGDEDCLTLNVYTPKKRRNELYPVMVFIHGGGFRDGSGSPLLYGPEHLVRHDVILVTMNYRLEILGFLCLGIKEAQGNMGLKDQVQALIWVKKNIRAFGGDPDNVTIFGESAGSVSVLYHVLSPMSKGLFHKGIMESGSAVSYWGIQFEPKHIAFKLAQQMGYNTTNVYEVFNIFKNKTAYELLRTRVPRDKGDIVQSENIFVPCIEEPIPEIYPFLTSSPYVALSSGQFHKVPIIIGFNSAEGYMFVGKENTTTKSKFSFISALPRDLTFANDAQKIKIAAKLSKLYSGYENNPQVSTETLVKYEGDAGIKYPVIATTDLLLNNTDKPVFSYKFSYSGLMNLVKIFFGFGTYPGASHGDELFYIFKPKGTLPLTLLERSMIDKMTTMWSNFAKYENPVLYETKLLPMKWEPLNPKYPRLFVIDREFSTEPLWNDDILLFWNETYAKYRRIN